MKYHLILFMILILGCSNQTDKSGVPAEAVGEQNTETPKVSLKKINIFRDDFKLGESFDRIISYSCTEKKIPEIIRNINSLTGIDIAIDPAVMKRARNLKQTLSVREIPLHILLDWFARFMNCYYIQGDSPDLWFVDEQEWLLNAPVYWDGYSTHLPSGEGGGFSMENLIAEFQKGLSWARNDIQPVHDPRRRLIMVNSTEQGHARLRKAIRAFTDRSIPPLERISYISTYADPAVLERMISCPEEQEHIRSVVRRIKAQAHVNVGWNSLLFRKEEESIIRLPLPRYSLRDLLEKIMEFTPIENCYWDNRDSLWLKHKDEPVFFRNRYVRWASMNAYVVGIESVAKKIRSEDLIKGIKTNVAAELWGEPCSLLKTDSSGNTLVIIQSSDVVKEVIRYLRTAVNFPRNQTNIR